MRERGQSKIKCENRRALAWIASAMSRVPRDADHFTRQLKTLGKYTQYDFDSKSGKDIDKCLWSSLDFYN